jgi:uncharacterized GH25 family protein
MKTQKRFNQFALIIVASLLMVTTAWGHSAWLEKRQDEIVVVYGHGASDDSYAPEKVVGVTAYSANGEVLEARTKEPKGGYVPLELAEGTTLVEIEFDNGFWSEDADGEWHNLPKTQVENAKQGGHYVKYGLTILDHFTALPASFDLPLVIIPQSDPLKLHAGDEFRIRVMYKGQPLADAEVIGDYVNQDSRVSAVTDADGFATLTIRNQGLNVIAVGKDEELTDNPDADKIGLMGSLSFTLRGAH